MILSPKASALLVAGGLGVGMLTTACVPPPDGGMPHLCERSKVSGRYFGTYLNLNCDPSGAPYIVVDRLCGPFFEPDGVGGKVCASIVQGATGHALIVPREDLNEAAGDVLITVYD